MTKHQLTLNFTGNTNEQTKVGCECGEECGTVRTGTKLPEVLALYKKHIAKEPRIVLDRRSNGREVRGLQDEDQDNVP